MTIDINLIIGVVGIIIGGIGLYYAWATNKKLKSSAISATRRILSIEATTNQLAELINNKITQIKNNKLDNTLILEIFNNLHEVNRCVQRDIRDSIEDWKDILGKDYDNFMKYRRETANAIFEPSLKYIELQDEIEKLSKEGSTKKEEIIKLKEEMQKIRKEMLNKIEDIKEKYHSPFVGESSVVLSGPSLPSGNSIISSFNLPSNSLGGVTIGLTERRKVCCPFCHKDLTLELEAERPGITEIENPLYSTSVVSLSTVGYNKPESLITCPYCKKQFNLKNAQ